MFEFTDHGGYAELAAKGRLNVVAGLELKVVVDDVIAGGRRRARPYISYFCDPHSPWQRGTKENTNGPLRDYFPKGTDLSVHSPSKLATVATELNQRPRKVLGLNTPHTLFATLLEQAHQP